MQCDAVFMPEKRKHIVVVIIIITITNIVIVFHGLNLRPAPVTRSMTRTVLPYYRRPYWRVAPFSLL
jgi:hypothetical protein